YFEGGDRARKMQRGSARSKCVADASPAHPASRLKLRPRQRYKSLQKQPWYSGSGAAMKILYGVVGEGMGHAIRSGVVLEWLLEQGHQVQVVASGRAHGYLKERVPD